MRNNQKLSILIWPNKQKEKNALLPIYIRISVDGKLATIATRHFVNVKHWDAKKNRVNTNSPSSNQINAFIDRSQNEIQQHFLNLAARGQMTSSMELKQLYLGIEEQTKHKTICDAFDYHNHKMAETVAVGKITRKTLLRYQSTQEKVVKFMKREYRIEDKALKDMRLSFITEFDHYLLTVEKLQSNTAHKIIKIVKKIMNQAVALDWIPSNPFNQFKCSYKNPERVVLSQAELDIMRNKNLSIPRLIEVRDIFIFQCYTGFAYTDIFNFKQNAVTIGIDGEYWLTTYRQKTGTKENVPLLPIALEIINKYKDHVDCVANDKLLPINSNQRYNSYLKELADICGINKKITTHIARHTFATTVTLSNGVPIETVSRMLGHTRLATTQIYAKVLEHKVSEDMLKLKAKLSANSENSAMKRTS
jgi:site-specific recombinase XerD